MFSREAIALGVCLAVHSASAVAQDAPKYAVVVAAPTPPYTLMVANGVNDLRHFHGGAESSSGTTFIFWTPEAGIIPLKSPLGEIVKIAAINNLDQLGVNTTAGPYIWSPVDGWRALAADADRKTTWITSINDKGQVVGYSFDGDGGLSDVTRHAVSWSKDGTLRVIKPNARIVPAQVNERQNVVATAYKPVGNGTEYEAVLSTHVGNYVRLGDYPGGSSGYFSIGVGIAEKNLIALNSFDDRGTMVACVWNAKRGVQPLDLGGGGESSAVGISRLGTIVGNANSFSIPYVFAWNAEWGAIDVSQHLKSGSPMLQKLYASGVSGSGNIAGSAIIDGVVNAVVLVPNAP